MVPYICQYSRRQRSNEKCPVNGSEATPRKIRKLIFKMVDNVVVSLLYLLWMQLYLVTYCCNHLYLNFAAIALLLRPHSHCRSECVAFSVQQNDLWKKGRREYFILFSLQCVLCELFCLRSHSLSTVFALPCVIWSVRILFAIFSQHASRICSSSS